MTAIKDCMRRELFDAGFVGIVRTIVANCDERGHVEMNAFTILDVVMTLKVQARSDQLSDNQNSVM